MTDLDRFNRLFIMWAASATEAQLLLALSALAGEAFSRGPLFRETSSRHLLVAITRLAGPVSPPK